MPYAAPVPSSFSSSTPPTLLLLNFRIIAFLRGREGRGAGACISLVYSDSPCKRVRVAQSSRGSSQDVIQNGRGLTRVFARSAVVVVEGARQDGAYFERIYMVGTACAVRNGQLLAQEFHSLRAPPYSEK